MQVPDGLLYKYTELCTGLNLGVMKALIERDIKEAHRVFARELVRLYHGEAPVAQAEERYDYVAKGGIPDDVPELRVPQGELTGGSIWICKLATLAGLTTSNGEARRLIQNRGLKVNGETVEDVQLQVDLSSPVVLQKGKDAFVRVSRGEVE
jgi:tyrosyl-tRNA synthetase